MNVTIIGSGYVGLTTAVALALIGHRTRVYDIDNAKIEGLRVGRAPFYEPGLEEALQAAQANLQFEYEPSRAFENADVVMIAVGTPPTPAGGANLGYLYTALRDLTEHNTNHDVLVVTKSTVPVGTGSNVSAFYEQATGRTPLIASAPEFLRQGRALADTLYPERLVFGTRDPRALTLLRELYEPIISQTFEPPAYLPQPQQRSTVPAIECSIESAELAKYAANAFLATKISFANEIANVCDLVGGDVQDVMAVLGLDSRIGAQFLQAGLGYGGSCFPKDTRALAQLSNREGYSFKLLSATIEVNNDQRFRVIDKLERHFGTLQGKDITVLGLTFKAGTDDLRDAPSLDIIAELVSRGARVTAHDPVALDAAGKMLPAHVRLCSEAQEALKGADAALLVTEWPEYRALDWRAAQRSMRHNVIIDGRNALDHHLLAEIGFVYEGVGRVGRRALPAPTFV
ncbi:UDP-glucose dehydrogenase family protein [Deinococcus yavapaiensis]|uniref:UDP-glucose dehydrogenase family protein n=1 Tax=Deinococcus yavapaiensis TaxID=309889 RepID=UPI001474FB5E|nr:UDP-glucose/GDP-mannose dehydrogenase family protein [Deinococcus yavapaiensis]